MGQVKILSASAGSGKTYRLAYRYIEVAILNPHAYRHILAVTFTNKATEEMKQRIIQEIDLLARGERSSFQKDLLKNHRTLTPEKIQERALKVRTLILHDYSNFAVMTIDRFFQRVIRSFMRELGIELSYTLELKTEDILSEATDNLIEGIADDSRLEGTIDEFIEGRIGENRKWDLRGDIAKLGLQLFNDDYIQASKPVSTEELLTLSQVLRKRQTETRAKVVSAAQSAMATIESAGLSIDDFRGASRSFAAHLHQWNTPTGPLPPFNHYKSMESSIDNPDEWLKPNRKDAINVIYSSVNANLHTMRDELPKLTTLGIILKQFDEYILLADLHNSLEELCRNKNILPLSKTSRLIGELIKDSDTPFIYEKVGSWFDYYMIDEFQDTSRSQWNNFKPLLSESVDSNEGQPVLLVGDVKQSIYRWRGGDWRILANDVEEYFSKTYPDCIDFEPLQTNYRSLQRVVEFNNALTASMVEQLSGNIGAKLSKAQESGQISMAEYHRLNRMISQAYADFEQIPNDQTQTGYVTLQTFDKANKQEPPIVECIKELQDRGYRPEDIAIIVRSNENAYKAANILLEYKRANPDSPYCFDIVTEEALRIDSSSSVKFIIACLKLSQNTEDTIHKAIYNHFRGDKYNDNIPIEELDFLLTLSSKSPEQAFESIVLRYGLCDHTEALAYIQALHQQIISFSSSKIADIPLFLRMWDERGCSESLVMPSGTAAITIITIHKSKGLAYKAVIMPYTDWKYSNESDTVWLQSDIIGESYAFPLTLSNSANDTEFAYSLYNERVMQVIDALNMLYVAITRAKSELHVMIPNNSKTFGSIINAAVPNLISKLEQKGDVKFTEASETTPMQFSYGSPVENLSERKQEEVLNLEKYTTSHITTKVRLHTPSERYSEDNHAKLSPRDKGILLHNIFQKAHTKEDIVQGVERLSVDSAASPQECNALIEKIERAFSDPLVCEWFSEGWQFVRNECDIILPNGNKSRRPDRVMAKDGRIVIVDYKFGRVRKEDHRQQIEQYAEILHQMGYTQVEGYLWYVNLDKRERVI